MQPQQLGPYRIERQIGRGGMGTVYAGVDVNTGEPAAIKVLATALHTDEDFRERFEVEIETLRMLRHENIVRLLGWGEQEGVLFYAMELVDGTSLEDELRGGRKFEWAEVKDIAVQVCAALKHAHDRGIIHRDIKPANLLIKRDGLVKLSDFGIAKLFGSAGMTTAGGIMGTAEYMAPEQADGRPVGHRCDLYSLGAVLYTLLAGRPPFVAKSVPELLQMQRFAQPEPIRRFNRGVPPEVEAIVMQLLEKDPERRIPNATVLARRLEATFRGLATLQVRKQLGGAAEGTDPPQAVTDAGEPSGEIGPTRIATRPLDSSRREDLDFEARTEGTDAAKPTAASGKVAGLSDSQARRAMKYTTVDEQPVGGDIGEGEAKRWMSPQTLLFSIALLAVGLTIYYFMQPAAADTLHQRVKQRIAQHRDRGLLDSQEDISTFLQYYSADPRAREMEGYERDIELLNMESRLERRVNRPMLGEPLTLVELAYLDALRVESSDPPGCVQKLDAICTLYESGFAASSPTARRCLKLAKRRADMMRPQAQKYVNDHLAQQKERLDQADRIEAGDPAEAAKIRQAVISLYGEKSWAAPVVQRAKAALARAEANPRKAGEGTKTDN
jgi:predicted Ser/Thr protein kinase